MDRDRDAVPGTGSGARLRLHSGPGHSSAKTSQDPFYRKYLVPGNALDDEIVATEKKLEEISQRREPPQRFRKPARSPPLSRAGRGAVRAGRQARSFELPLAVQPRPAARDRRQGERRDLGIQEVDRAQAGISAVPLPARPPLRAGREVRRRHRPVRQGVLDRSLHAGSQAQSARHRLGPALPRVARDLRAGPGAGDARSRRRVPRGAGVPAGRRGPGSRRVRGGPGRDADGAPRNRSRDRGRPRGAVHEPQAARHAAARIADAAAAAPDRNPSGPGHAPSAGRRHAPAAARGAHGRSGRERSDAARGGSRARGGAHAGPPPEEEVEPS